DADDVELPVSNQTRMVALLRDQVGMPPPVLLAEPEKLLPAVESAQVIHHVHPGAILIAMDPLDGAGVGISQQHVIGVLKPVQMLEYQLVRVSSPPHSRDVVIARIARDFHPSCGSTRRTHHTHSYGRIAGSCLRVTYVLDLRIDTNLGIRNMCHDLMRSARVVDQGKIPDSARIELPIGNPLPVGTPPEPVPKKELLLIDPIRRPVDDGLRSIAREPDEVASVQIFHVQVVR